MFRLLNDLLPLFQYVLYYHVSPKHQGDRGL